MKRASQQDWSRQTPQGRPHSISMPSQSPNYSRPHPFTASSYGSSLDHASSPSGPSPHSLSVDASQFGSYDSQNTQSVLDSLTNFATTEPTKDLPWNPYRLHPSAGLAHYESQQQLQQAGLGLSFTNYRRGPRSDVSSAITNVNPLSDSGYHTGRSFSTYSGEPVAQALPCPELQEPFGNFSPFQAQRPPSPLLINSADPARVKQLVVATSPVQNREKAYPYTCDRCGHKVRLPSDLKKHLLKHDKPHHCPIPNCKRTGGFTTSNDLDRHMKDIHKICSGTTTTYYRCKSPACINKAKTFSRPDNFRQHLGRLHKDEDRTQLFKDSEMIVPVNPSQQILSYAPLTPIGIENFNRPFNSSSNKPISWTTDIKVSESNLINDAVPNPFDASPSLQEMPTTLNESDSSMASTLEGDDSVMSIAQTPPDCKINPQPMTATPSSLNIVEESGIEMLGPNSTPVVYQNWANQDNELAYMFSATPAQPKQRNHSISEEDLHPASDTVTEVRLSSTEDCISSNGETNQLPEQAAPKKNTDDAMSSASSQAQTGASSLSSAKSGCAKTDLPGRQSRGSAEKIQCSHCNALCNRPCDMKKHMRRHTRPFGCTFSACDKDFGSKNDWKRHESSQHFQADVWRCGQPRIAKDLTYSQSKSLACAKLFQKKAMFQKHLTRDHELQKSEIEAETKRSHIGFNGQRQFWCGFCQSIRALEGRGVKAWDERFSHISKHFTDDDKHIDTWLMPGNNMTKGQVKKDNQVQALDREYCDSDYSDDDNSTNDAPPPLPPVAPIDGAETTNASSSSTTTSTNTININNDNDNSNSSCRAQNGVSQNMPPPQHHFGMYEKLSRLFCCVCSEGPQTRAVHDSCVACAHFFCERCQAPWSP